MKKNEKPGALRRIFRRKEDYLRLFFYIFIFYSIFLFIYLLIFDFQPQFFFWVEKVQHPTKFTPKKGHHRIKDRCCRNQLFYVLESCFLFSLPRSTCICAFYFMQWLTNCWQIREELC